MGQTRPKSACRLGPLLSEQQSWERDYRRSGHEFRLLAASCQLVEQRFGLSEIGGVEAFGDGNSRPLQEAEFAFIFEA
jgi:hypothetical protein